MNFAFPTVITSGTILAVAGALIGQMTSEAAIVGIGQSIGRVVIDGMGRGEIHGTVSGTVHATVDGDVNVNLISGNIAEEGDDKGEGKENEK